MLVSLALSVPHILRIGYLCLCLRACLCLYPSYIDGQHSFVFLGLLPQLSFLLVLHLCLWKLMDTICTHHFFQNQTWTSLGPMKHLSGRHFCVGPTANTRGMYGTSQVVCLSPINYNIILQGTRPEHSGYTWDMPSGVSNDLE